MGVKVLFEVRNAETLHSIFQMRYASKPSYVQVGMKLRYCAGIEACLPELIRLVESVKAKKDCPVAFVKIFPALLVACETL